MKTYRQPIVGADLSQPTADSSARPGLADSSARPASPINRRWAAINRPLQWIYTALA